MICQLIKCRYELAVHIKRAEATFIFAVLNSRAESRYYAVKRCRAHAKALKLCGVLHGRERTWIIGRDGIYSRRNLCELNADTIHTVEVYVVDAIIRQTSTAYSVNTYVGDGNVELMLYAGGKDQYKWLAEYAGQAVKMELAVCDWNNKGNKGCVLSITLEDGTKIYNELNFTK